MISFYFRNIFLISKKNTTPLIFKYFRGYPLLLSTSEQGSVEEYTNNENNEQEPASSKDFQRELERLNARLEPQSSSMLNKNFVIVSIIFCTNYL